MIDSHAHLDDPRCESALASRLEAERARGVRGWVVPGVDLGTIDRRRAVLAQLGAAGLFGTVRFAVGVHPYFAASTLRSLGGPDQVETLLVEAAEELDAVAIGETGFDKSKPEYIESLDDQAKLFELSVRVANQLRLPIIVHLVRAEGELLRALKTCVPEYGGVVHGFSGGPESAEQLLKRDLYLGFGMSLLRRGSDADTPLARAAARVPLDRILVETDAPDQTEDLLGVVQVVHRLAEIRDEHPEDLAGAIRQNTETLFQCSFQP